MLDPPHVEITAAVVREYLERLTVGTDTPGQALNNR